MKILVIDDEPDVRRIATLSLVNVGGFEVIEAAGGTEGLARAAEEQPDAILLDVMMPVMDGPTTLAALRADERTRGIPVIFVTARAMSSDVERLRSLGATGILTKPFNAMTLSSDVRTLLR